MRWIEATNDMWLFAWIRSFDRPSFLRCFSGFANVDYAECRHAGSLILRLEPRNLGKIEAELVPPIWAQAEFHLGLET